MRAISRGRARIFVTSGSVPESSTETRESRERAWLGMTPGSNER